MPKEYACSCMNRECFCIQSDSKPGEKDTVEPSTLWVFQSVSKMGATELDLFLFTQVGVSWRIQCFGGCSNGPEASPVSNSIHLERNYSKRNTSDTVTLLRQYGWLNADRNV